MLRVLITGGSGLIAGRLAQYFTNNSDNNKKISLGSRGIFASSYGLSKVELIQLVWENDAELKTS